MLYAREVPPSGGDTLFANQYLAYETLSAGMKRMLDGLIAINSSAKADASRTREDRVMRQERDDAEKEYVAEHPVVRTHPETGRKALYVNVAHTVRFKDMTGRRARRSSRYLFQHQITPRIHLPLPLARSARSLSGTIAARSTTRSTTITATAASCTASRSRATRRAEPNSHKGERCGTRPRPER